jgi:hypothetical protein
MDIKFIGDKSTQGKPYKILSSNYNIKLLNSYHWRL